MVDWNRDETHPSGTRRVPRRGGGEGPQGAGRLPGDDARRKDGSKVICPLKNRKITPSRCLLCPHFGGLRNQGVLCYRANRWIPYEIVRREI